MTNKDFGPLESLKHWLMILPFLFCPLYFFRCLHLQVEECNKLNILTERKETSKDFQPFWILLFFLMTHVPQIFSWFPLSLLFEAKMDWLKDWCELRLGCLQSMVIQRLVCMCVRVWCVLWVSVCCVLCECVVKLTVMYLSVVCLITKLMPISLNKP